MPGKMPQHNTTFSKFFMPDGDIGLEHHRDLQTDKDLQAESHACGLSVNKNAESRLTYYIFKIHYTRRRRRLGML